MAEAYPLQWPLGFARAKGREPGRFKTTLPAALKTELNAARDAAVREAVR